MSSKILSEDDISLLVVIVDTNPFSWINLSKSNDSSEAIQLFSQVLEHLIIFINSYLALNHDNQLAVLASHIKKSHYLYPSINSNQRPQNSSVESTETPNGEDTPTSTFSTANANKYQQFFSVDNEMINNLKELMSSTDGLAMEEYQNKGSPISATLSLALLYIQRVLRQDELGLIKPRILVISASNDSPIHYIPTMNCIFSAQKAMIPIDVCNLGKLDTIFLQQAAHLTDGVYLKIPRIEGLLEYLMFAFLPDRYTRQFLCLPTLDQVDFRAACFCHKKIIDIGYVCSICLSIFCEWSEVCSTCKTKFSFGPLSRGQKRINPPT
ncbi:TFIIH subunit Tfb4/p34 [Paraphysoderma sedebokerense]|nr:TFIIH subunit Tfb4/p34 [Paraphysoderma sedebokerense]